MLKVAEDTYRLANQKGVLNSYLTWCKLKTYNTHGTIKRDRNSIEKASKFLSKSPSNLRLHLRKLIKLGLVVRNKYSYSLVSYDRAWSILGVDTDYNDKKGRGGNFIIFKFNTTVDLKERIELAEIKIHVSRQAYQARKSILRDTQNFTDTERKSLKNCRFIDLPDFLDTMYEEKLSVLENVELFIENVNMVRFCELQGKRTYNYTKITPYLTCERTSSILGYESNPRTGQMIRKRIESCGLAYFNTREVKFLSTLQWGDALRGVSVMKKSPSRIRDNGEYLSHRIISKMIIR